jgi:hypothetical protein
MRYLAAIAISALCIVGLSACSKPQSLPPQALSSDELESRARTFTSLLSAARYQEAVGMMEARMAAAMPAKTAEETWGTLLAQVGSFESIARARVASESGFQVVYVTCKFMRAALDAKVVFDVAGKVAGLWFGPSSAPSSEYKTPAYARTTEFTEMECTIGEGKWKLPATLTIPSRDSSSPAIVLVQGSGPLDRDETVGPNKPFKDLAWGLASNGIAVLRYEKRTKRYASDIAAALDSFTVDQEVVEDAVAAVAYLRHVKGVDPARVFVLGHSLGGSLGPRIAAMADERGNATIAGLVLLAPNARSIVDLIVEQVEYIAALDGRVDEAESADLQKVRSDADRIKGGRLQVGEIVLGGSKAYWEDLLKYDPVAAAKTLGLPVLLLQGERDYQVTMEDFAVWKDALQGKAGVTLRSLPGLNHLFMKGEGKASPSEYDMQGNIDQDVIEAIVSWLKAR